MKLCIPFVSAAARSLAPVAASCSGGGPDCSGAYSGGGGFCVSGAGLLPEPPGFPAPPATSAMSGPAGLPVETCAKPEKP